MTSAPKGAGQAWSAITGLVACAFTRPSFGIFCDLVAGWVLTPGRRTITRIIGVIDPGHRRAHDAYHRFVRDGAWEMHTLWRVLTVTIVERLVSDDASVFLDLDDTVFHKTGRKIEGAGSFRDAVNSTRKRVVYTLGLNLVVITVLRSAKSAPGANASRNHRRLPAAESITPIRCQRSGTA